MNLAVWAGCDGVTRVESLVSHWALPGPARKVGRLILVNDAVAETVGRGRTAVYARVSSADQKARSGSAGGVGDRVG